MKSQDCARTIKNSFSSEQSYQLMSHSEKLKVLLREANQHLSKQNYPSLRKLLPDSPLILSQSSSRVKDYKNELDQFMNSTLPLFEPQKPSLKSPSRVSILVNFEYKQKQKQKQIGKAVPLLFYDNQMHLKEVVCRPCLLIQVMYLSDLLLLLNFPDSSLLLQFGSREQLCLAQQQIFIIQCRSMNRCLFKINPVKQHDMNQKLNLLIQGYLVYLYSKDSKKKKSKLLRLELNLTQISYLGPDQPQKRKKAWPIKDMLQVQGEQSQIVLQMKEGRERKRMQALSAARGKELRQILRFLLKQLC